MKSRIVCVLGLAVVAATARPVEGSAFTLRFDDLDGICRPGLSNTVSAAPVAAGGSWLCNGGSTGAASASAFAGPGAIGAAATAFGTGGPGSGAGSAAFAEMRSTFTITAPEGGPSSIPISLNFLLSGDAESSDPSLAGWGINVNARQFGTGAIRFGLPGTGLLAGFAAAPDGSLSLSTLITTPTALFNVSATHILQLSIGLAATARRGLAPSTASIDFAHTLEFPTTGPVFNLPDGYSISIPDLFIFDNRYVPEAVATVPEPSSLVLTGLGLTAAAGMARARRRRVDGAGTCSAR